jgi:sporulation protein YlmC with PRC-barrel domain
MRIDLSAKLQTSDGHDAGNVRRVLFDPASERITGFVVSTSRLLGRDVIVGQDAFAEVSPGGDAVTLGLSKSKLDQQPGFEETDYVLPPADWAAPVGYDFPATAYLWPVGTGETSGEAPPRSSLKKGDVVKDRDGDVVGVVHDVRFDETSRDLIGIVVKAGAGLERLVGGGEIAEISRDDILRIVEGEVRLGVDREEIVPEHQTQRPR